MDRKMKKSRPIRGGAAKDETAEADKMSHTSKRMQRSSTPHFSASVLHSAPDAGVGEVEEEEGRSSPVITMLYSRPHMRSPQREQPCTAVVGGGPVCESFKPPPPPPPHPTSALADATRIVLDAIDFRSQVEALMDNDYDEESEVATSEQTERDEENDFVGMDLQQKSLDVEPCVTEEYDKDVQTVREVVDVYTSTTQECPCYLEKPEPLIWSPEEAQFEVLWDLLDPRASVRDIEEEEEGPAKNRLERTVDFLQDISNYFKISFPEKCSNMLELRQNKKANGEIDLFRVPFSNIDDPLREKNYRELTDELLKAKEAIKCSEEPMTEDQLENLRNLQYISARWLIKHLDNEYSFLPKKKKDKILIPHDPTIDYDVSIILHDMLLKINPSNSDLHLSDEHKTGNEKLALKDASTTESDELMRNEEIQDTFSKSLDDYTCNEGSNINNVTEESMDALNIESSIKDLVIEIQEGAIQRYIEQEESKSDVLNVLNYILEGLGEEEKLGETMLSELRTKEESKSSTNQNSAFSLEILGTILAKFHLENERCFSREYNLSVDLNDIRSDLSKMCKVSKEMIVIEYEGKVLLSRNILMENTTLQDIRKEGAEEIDFHLKSIDDLRYPLQTYELTMETPGVQTREVTVVVDQYETRMIRLTVLDDCIVKPFIGGFRNKSTGVELHNAFTQTGPFLRKVNRTHRDTQTASLKSVSIETVQHKQTQMWRRDCFITPEYDYIIASKPYIEADLYLELMRYEEMAFKIQKSWRKHLLWNLMKQFADKARECKHHEIVTEKRRLREIADRHRLDLVHKMYPRTKADFDMWYAMIEKWRVQETEKAELTRDAAGRRATMLKVLLRESELLRQMEYRRTRLLEEKREKRDLALVEACAQPVEWTTSNGCKVSMDTQRTQRARELEHLYHALARADVTVEERMEVLMQLKYALAPFPQVLPMQLIRLIERESELLLKGLRREDQIDLLHRRVLQMYLELLKDPDFNPEAAKHSLEHNVARQHNTWHQCVRCARLKKKTAAMIHATTRALRHCDMCEWVQHIGSRRHDLCPYRVLMRAIRRDEAKRRAYTSVAFVMRDIDFFWLINLWHAESFLTEAEDLGAMRMPRWDARREWSPWNCILLTDDETKWHLRLRTLEEGYSQELMGEVNHRHVTARLHFRDILKSDKYYRESCKWFNASRKKSFVAPSKEADAFKGISESCPLPQTFKRPTT